MHCFVYCDLYFMALLGNLLLLVVVVVFVNYCFTSLDYL